VLGVPSASVTVAQTSTALPTAMNSAQSGAPSRSSTIPEDAPSLLWMLVAAAVLWWFWPCFERYRSARKATTTQSVEAAPTESAVQAATAMTTVKDVSKESVPMKPATVLRSAAALGLDIPSEFEVTFKDAAHFIANALQVPPQGLAYKEATAALHRTGEVIDKIFQRWDSEEERLRFSRLREDTESFKRVFGEHPSGNAARSLLGLAGFERQSGGVWAFNFKDAHAQLRGLVVRLCLQKHADLQKSRGSQVWAQSNNEAVVPKLESAVVSELFVLYQTCCGGMTPPELSWRERNTEVAVRVKLHERRREAGQSVSLVLHEGLATAARILASAQRTKKRAQQGDIDGRLVGPSDEEAHDLIAKLPLPPGFDVVHLHCTTSELPHVFGLTSSTGKAGDEGDSDKAAEVIANEVASLWATRKAREMCWPSATIYGVGACLDYTINHGFVTALLIGFEGLPPTEELAAARKERAQLKERKAEVPKHTGLGPYGARVQTMQSMDPPSSRRRKGGG